MASEKDMLFKGSGLPNRRRIRKRTVGKTEHGSIAKKPAKWWTKMVDGQTVGTAMFGKFVKVVSDAPLRRGKKKGWVR